MSIWFVAPTLAEVNAGSAGTLSRHLDILVTDIGADYIRGTMPVDARTRQPFGVLHGGASVVLAETLGSIGAWWCVDRSRYLCLGQEINANHLRPVQSGVVTGTSRPVHRGQRSQVWATEIVDAEGKLVCISRLTIAVVGISEPRSVKSL